MVERNNITFGSYIKEMEKRKTNGLEVTLIILSHLLRQHIGVLVSDLLWTSANVELDQLGLFYIFSKGKFLGCSRKQRIPLKLKVSELVKDILKEDYSDKIKEAATVLTPKRGNLLKADEAFDSYDKDKVLSPILEKNSTEPSQLSEDNLTQPVFPPRDEVTMVHLNSPNISQEAIVSAKQGSDSVIDKPVGYEKVEYGCAKCSSQFESLQGYYSHMFEDHRIRKKVRHPPKIIRTYVKLQEVCDDRQQTVQHEPDNSMECAYCEREFLTHGNLRLHLRNQHPLFKPDFCSHCPRVFYADDGLEKHMHEFHNETNGGKFTQNMVNTEDNLKVSSITEKPNEEPESDKTKNRQSRSRKNDPLGLQSDVASVQGKMNHQGKNNLRCIHKKYIVITV